MQKTILEIDGVQEWRGDGTGLGQVLQFLRARPQRTLSQRLARYCHTSMESC